jgi:hypothetical protein
VGSRLATRGASVTAPAAVDGPADDSLPCVSRRCSPAARSPPARSCAPAAQPRCRVATRAVERGADRGATTRSSSVGAALTSRARSLQRRSRWPQRPGSPTSPPDRCVFCVSSRSAARGLWQRETVARCAQQHCGGGWRKYRPKYRASTARALTRLLRPALFQAVTRTLPAGLEGPLFKADGGGGPAGGATTALPVGDHAASAFLVRHSPCPSVALCSVIFARETRRHSTR